MGRAICQPSVHPGTPSAAMPSSIVTLRRLNVSQFLVTFDRLLTITAPFDVPFRYPEPAKGPEPRQRPIGNPWCLFQEFFISHSRCLGCSEPSESARLVCVLHSRRMPSPAHSFNVEGFTNATQNDSSDTSYGAGWNVIVGGAAAGHQEDFAERHGEQCDLQQAAANLRSEPGSDRWPSQFSFPR